MCWLLENKSRIPKYTCHICHAFCMTGGTKSTEFFFYGIWGKQKQKQPKCLLLEVLVYKWNFGDLEARL